MMKLSVLFQIALKSIWGKKLRSILTIGGVVVGIGAIVFLVSVGYGLQNLIVEKATGLDALRIIDVSTVKSQIIRLDEDSIGRFSSFENVDNVQVVVNVPGRVKVGGSTTDTVVFGAPVEYLDLSGVKVDQGSVYENDSSNAIINSAALNVIGIKPEQYQTFLGKEVNIELVLLGELIATNDSPEEQTVNSEVTLTIGGIINDDNTPYIFVPLKVLTDQGIHNYSQAKVRVKDNSQLANVRDTIESLGFSTKSASDTVQQIDQIFSIFRIVVSGFGAIGLVVASLGMFNTLTVSLLERTREIGLMKALGAKRRDIFALFLFEALIISGIGGILGVIFGYALGETGNYVLNTLAVATGNEPVDIFQTPVVFVIGLFLFSLLVGFLTGLYPSRRARGLNPLDALRFE
ncbi:FtsX-like permease family protein [bacterium]|nr:FtsX-like permease family protein [bacterium]